MKDALRPDYLNGKAFLTKLADLPASDSPAANLKTFSHFGFTGGTGPVVSFDMDVLVPPLANALPPAGCSPRILRPEGFWVG